MSPTNTTADDLTTIGELRREMAEFVRDRDWEQFHAPKNLAMSLAIEAAELMELFQWIGVEESRPDRLGKTQRTRAAEEISDVLAYLLALANVLGLDLTDAFRRKMAQNRSRYPAEEFRGVFGHDDPRREARS